MPLNDLLNLPPLTQAITCPNCFLYDVKIGDLWHRFGSAAPLTDTDIAGFGKPAKQVAAINVPPDH